MSWRRIVCEGASLLVASVLFAHPLQAQVADEQRLKVAFIYNFLQYVEWPAESFASPEQAMVVCVYGRDVFEGNLTALTRKMVRSRPIEVRVLMPGEPATKCHLLYLDDPFQPEVASALKQMKDRPVLTVSTGGDVAGGRVAVDFVRHEGRLRFVINLEAIRAARLHVSAKMAEVALTVFGNQRP